MSTTNELRFGVVGAGGISTHTAREIAASAHARIVAVAEPNTERRTEFQARFDVEGGYADLDEMLTQCRLDALYIGVPNRWHAELAIAGLTAGKHVLLDKPFAMSLPEAEAVADAARTSDAVFMLGMNQRFSPDVQRARLLAESGRLGDVYHVKAYWRRRRGIPRIGSWFTDRATSGGGALLDIGVHMLDASLHVLGDFRVRTVTGAAYTTFGQRGLGDGNWGRSERSFERFDVDDFATALLRLESGATVSLDAAWALHMPQANDMDIVLHGSDAGYATYQRTLFEFGDHDGEYRLTQAPVTGELPFPHCSRVSHFVNVIRGEEQPLVDIEQALAVQRVLDAIYQSSQSGAEVPL